MRDLLTIILAVTLGVQMTAIILARI